MFCNDAKIRDELIFKTVNNDKIPFSILFQAAFYFSLPVFRCGGTIGNNRQSKPNICNDNLPKRTDQIIDTQNIDS